MQKRFLKNSKSYKNKLNASFVAVIMLLSTMTTMAGFFAAPAAADVVETEPSIWTTDINGNPVDDFPPGEIVYIHGEGFTPGEPINMSMERPDGELEYADSNLRFMDGEPVANSTGGFGDYPIESCRYDLDGIEGDYTIDATDKNGNSKTYTFTDWHEIKSVTLDGGSNTLVNSGDPISVSITVKTGGIWYNDNWRSTQYEIEGESVQCVDTYNYNGDGEYSDTFSINAPTSPGTYDIRFRVRDNSYCIGGASDWKKLTDGIIINTPPTADAGGPYISTEGTSLSLDGSASYDPDTASGDSIVGYRWDLDNDGSYDDATGTDPNILDVDTYWSVGSNTIGLEVEDSFGATGTTTTTVKIEESVITCIDNDADGYDACDASGDPVPGCDDPCDCDDNDELEHPGQVWYKDEDNDGYSDGTTIIQCERPADYKVSSELTATSGDCNDNDDTIYPGAPEIDDGEDNDCDGKTDEGICEPYSCLIPDDLEDTTDIDVNGNSLQSILTAYDYDDYYDISDIVVDGIGNDQSHIQVWDYQSGMDVIEFYIEFVGHEAGYSNVFGYYTDGDVSTFTPIFQIPGSGGVHDGYPSVVQLTSGESLSEVLVPTGNTGELGFAVCSDTDSGDGTGTNLTHFTDTSKNDDGMDHALVYELCNDTYIICFEDKEESISDEDYQDVIVLMKVTDCYQNLDFGDAPDAVNAPLYPTLLANDGARHHIGGPYLGSIAPDAETDGQPDADALGDDNNGFDDEDGVTFPALEIGTTNTITCEVNGGGGHVWGWIDFNADGDWDNSGEQVISGEYKGNGIHTFDVNIPSGLSEGYTYARFRIVSDDDCVGTTGLAEDGEVEDYKVELVDTTDPDQTIEYGQPNQTTDVWGNMIRIGGNTPIYINSTDVGTGTEYMIIDVWWDNGQIPGDTDEGESCNPNNYNYRDRYTIYDKNCSNADTYAGLDTDETFGKIAVNLTIDESCFHEIDAYCYDRVGNGNIVRDDILVDADGPEMEHKVGDPNCTNGVNLFVNTSTEITLTAEDFTPFCENCTANCVDNIYWNITYDEVTKEYNTSGDTAVFNFTEECHHIVYYWAVDCLGNIGPVYGPFNFYVDETPPESNISFDPECLGQEKTYIKNTSLITISADDSDEGCTVGTVLIHYRVWADGQWTNWMTGTFDEDVTFTLEDLGMPWADDCTHYIEYWAKDCLHNAEDPVKKVTVYVDNTGPEKVEMAISSGLSHIRPDGKVFVTTDTFIKLSTPDDQIKPDCASGTTAVYYQIWNETSGWGETQTYDGPFNFEEKCKHQIKAWAEDCLGNIGEENITIFYVDEDAPGETTEFVPPPFEEEQEDGFTWYWISNNTVKVITAHDTGCIDGGVGVEKIFWSIETETSILVSGYVYDNQTDDYSDQYVTVTGDNNPEYGVISINVTIEESCHHFIIHDAYDYLGNVIYDKQHVYVDTLPPVIIKTIGDYRSRPRWIQEDDYFVTNQTRITIDATDNESNYPCNVSSVHMLVGIEYPADVWNYTWYNVTEGTAHCDFTFEEAGVGEECMHNVTIYAEDDVGNGLWYDEETFYVDNTPPDVTKEIGKPKFNDGSLPDGDWFITRHTPIWINVTDNGTDPCIVGSTHLYYRVLYDDPTGDNQMEEFEVHNYSGPINHRFTFDELALDNDMGWLGDDCNHTLELYVEDNLHNRWPETGYYTEHFYIDNTPPELTKEVGSPQYPVPNCDDYYITKDTRIWINVTEQGVTDECTVGSTTLHRGILYKGNWYNDTIHHEKTDGPIYYNFTFNELSAKYPELANDCEHLLVIWAEDNLGNIVTHEDEIFYVDNTPPDVTKEVGEPKYNDGTLPDGDWYVTKNTPIYINVTDNQTKGCAVNSTHIKFTLTYNGRTETWWENESDAQNIEYTFNELSSTRNWADLDDDCEHVFTVEAWDNLGNYYGEHTETFYVDNTPPDATKEVGEPKYEENLPDGATPGQDWYVTKNTPIYINVTDNQTKGCAVNSTHIKFTLTYNGRTETWWENSSTAQNIEYSFGRLVSYLKTNYGIDWPELRNDCEHILTFEAWDNLGNYYGPHQEHFFVDNTEPELTKELGEPKYKGDLTSEGDWYIRNDTKIWINVTDQGKGNPPCIVGSTHLNISILYKGKYYYKQIDEPNGPIRYNFTFEEIAQELGLELADNCVHELSIWAEDNLGNRNDSHPDETFYVDNTPPETTKSFDGPTCPANESDIEEFDLQTTDEINNFWVTTDTEITLTAEDLPDLPCKSGIKDLFFEVYWDHDNDSCANQLVGVTIVEDNLPNSVTFKFEQECLHKIEWYAVDNLGNKEVIHIQYHRVDDSAPEIIKTVGEPSITDDEITWWVTTDTNVNLTAHDLEWPCAVGGVTLWYNISYRTLDNYTGWKLYTKNITFSEHCTHYLHVKAVDCLGNTNYDNETFIVHGEIDQIPTLQSPADGSTISDNTPLLDWNDVVGQSNYRVQYADNIDFTGATTFDVSGASEYEIPTVLNDGVYYWHVAVIYTGGVVGQYSDTWWFDVDAHAPGIKIDSIISSVTDSLEITTTTSDDDIEDVVFEYMYGPGDYVTIGTDDTYPFSIAWDTTTVIDGPYTIRATATDDAGNTGFDTKVFEIDNGIAGVPTLIQPADGSLMSYKPILLWNAVEDASGYRIEIYDDFDNGGLQNLIVSADVASTSYDTYTLGLTDNNEYYWRVAALDSDGDQLGQNSSTWWFMVDLNAPEIKDVDCSDSDHTIVVGDTVVFTVAEKDHETGLSGTIQIGSGDDYIYGLNDNDNGAYTYSWHIPEDFTPGTYTVHATLIDAVGRTDTKSTLELTIIETSGPMSSIIDVTPDPTNSDIMFYAELTSDETRISDAEYKIDVTGTPVAIPETWLDDDSYDATYEYITSESIDILSLSDGEHVLFVRAKDENGNWGPWDEEEFIVDTTAPIVTINNPTEGTQTGTDIELNVETNEDAACEYQLDGGSWSTMDITGSTTHSQTIDGLSDGEHTITVRATDNLGNGPSQDTVTWIVSESGPTSTITDILPDPTKSDVTMTGGFSSTTSTIVDAEYKIGLTGTPVKILNSDLDDGSYDETQETFTKTIPLTDLSEGINTVYLRSQDANGDWGIWTEEEITKDTTAPIITINNPTQATSTGQDVELIVSTDEIASCTYSLDGSDFTSMSHTDSTTHTQMLIGLSDGEHTITVNATDNLGNGPSQDTVTWTVTHTGPTTSGTDVDPDSSIVGTQLEITATVHSTISEVVDAEFFIDTKGPAGTGYTLYPTDGTWDGTSEDVNATIDTTTWTAGEYTVYARGKDADGHWGAFDEEEFTLVEESQWRPVSVNILEPDNEDEITVECDNRYIPVTVEAYRPEYDGLPKDYDVEVTLWLDQPYGAPDIFYDLVWNETDKLFYGEIPIYMYRSGSELNLEAKAEDEYGNRMYEDTTFTVITTIEYDQWMDNGWNSLTLPHGIIECDDSVGSVLASIDAKYSSVFHYDETAGIWSSYVPGREFNTLETITEGKNYWIYMTESARFFVDVTCPDIEIYYPKDEEINTQCFDIDPINGYVCDTETGVKEVMITIYDEYQLCSPYWNGTDWVSEETYLTCIFDENTHTWQYPGDVNLTYKTGHKIIITAYATDFAGCTCFDTSYFYFNDTGIPVINIVNPEEMQYGCDEPSLINGTAYDNPCETVVTNVYMEITRISDETFNGNGETSQYWDGSSWVEYETQLACEYDEETHEWEYIGDLPSWENDQEYTVIAYAEDEAGNVGSATVSFSYLCCDIPEFTNLELLESTDTTIWDDVTKEGDYKFTMCLNESNDFHYIDIDNSATNTNTDLKEGYYPFYLNTTNLPDDFYLPYWQDKGVYEGCKGTWEPTMWNITNGTEPMLYLHVDNGQNMMLVDGLLNLTGQGNNHLRINGDYPLGSYNFTGTVNGTCADKVSDPITINMIFTECNQPPYMPYNPDPESGGILEDNRASCSYSVGDPDVDDTVTYTYYFGTSPTPAYHGETSLPWPATTTRLKTSFGDVEPETKYYWQIVAEDNHGAVTEGPVWNFTTKECFEEIDFTKTLWNETSETWEESIDVETEDIITCNISIYLPEDACATCNGNVTAYIPSGNNPFGFSYIDDSTNITAVFLDGTVEYLDTEPFKVDMPHQQVGLIWNETNMDSPMQLLPGMHLYFTYNVEVKVANPSEGAFAFPATVSATYDCEEEPIEMDSDVAYVTVVSNEGYN